MNVSRLIFKLLELVPSILDAFKPRSRYRPIERPEEGRPVPPHYPPGRSIHVPGLRAHEDKRSDELMDRLTDEATERMRKEREE